MDASIGAELVEAQAVRSKLWYKLKSLPLLPLAIMAVFLIFAIFADFIAPYSPYESDLGQMLLPPSLHSGHLMGTDVMGMDIFSRIIFGSRYALIVSVTALTAGGGLGVILGMISGYAGDKVDAVLMRITDGAYAVPTILLALLFAVVLGPGITTMIIAIAAVTWSRFARVTRAAVLKVKTEDYIAMARVTGCSAFRILVVHIFPQVLNTVLVVSSLQIGGVILLEASLSFLGAGIPPPTPSWGMMVADGRNYIADAWWISLFPGAAIMLLVLAVNFLGDWITDAIDPRLRQV